jgi:xanthine dehydrogenase small subunit
VFPALDEMLPWFAARQVQEPRDVRRQSRQASPIGDLLPILLAHDATMHWPARTARATRHRRLFPRLPQDATCRRRTDRRGDASASCAASVTAYKIAKRQTDDISIVAAVYALELDASAASRTARLAYGGVAAIPKRALRSEAMLLGQVLDAATVVDCRRASLHEEFTPLSDHRADADYRRAAVRQPVPKFVAEASGMSMKRTKADHPRVRRRPRHRSRDLCRRAASEPVGLLSLYPVQAPHAHARTSASCDHRCGSRRMPGVRAPY